MASPLRARTRFITTIVTVGLLVATAVSGFAGSEIARADSSPTNPANPSTPTTVTADALPTAQINGVVWSQAVSGRTVFAGGKFIRARPAGKAVGSSEVIRSNILSYDVVTGVISTKFAPLVNGQVRAVAVSADGTRVFIGGSFTAIGTIGRQHLAELDATTGAVISTFNPAPNNVVSSLTLRGTTLYLGGAFTALGRTARPHVAAVYVTSGAIKPLVATVAGGDVNALAVSPDSNKLIIGGTFTSVRGSTNPGYGLAAIDARSGALLHWSSNSVVRDGGVNAGITSLTADSTGLYGSGFVYGSGGDLEGTFRADWTTGALTWLEDCHGDSYSTAVTATAEYVAGHAHYCGNINGFPDTPGSGTHMRAIAFSKAATQKITADPYPASSGYASFAGQPAPSLLDWFPVFDVGTVTGQSQGPWSVAAGDGYVVYGGEFTTVNGVPQQGLVRFASHAVAPRKQGPVLSGASLVPTVTSTTAGSATVTWPADFDPDNETLRYEVFRNGGWVTPSYTVTADSTFWNRPALTFVDTGLTPGAQVSYRLRVTDPDGNQVVGDSAWVTIAQAAASTPQPTSTPSSTPSDAAPSNQADPGTATG